MNELKRYSPTLGIVNGNVYADITENKNGMLVRYYDVKKLQQRIAELEAELKLLKPCKRCGGRGFIDDAEPGDISFNKYDCPECKDNE